MRDTLDIYVSIVKKSHPFSIRVILFLFFLDMEDLYEGVGKEVLMVQ